MSIAESAITTELPPGSVLPPGPLRRPELSETTAGNVDRATAGPNINRASWKGRGRQGTAFRGHRGSERGCPTCAPRCRGSGADRFRRTDSWRNGYREGVDRPSDSQPECPTGSTPYQTQLCRLPRSCGVIPLCRPIQSGALIPSGLLESELFGHERGAFTGALMLKTGRFELADKGTLFLDEVGDIPLELQPKLLRVLQEHEFERLGSTHTQQVDVRVVAATHRDLKEMVKNGEFRSDLYYRLHVFPLSVPALRERREDIPLLVRHFVDEYARRMNRRIETISAQAIEALTHYSLPANVRELQNFIEHAVILSPGKVLRPPLAELKGGAVQTAGSELSACEKMEREHVLGRSDHPTGRSVVLMVQPHA